MQQSQELKLIVRLVEWLIREMNPLILIAGNHDMWSGNSDPVQWMKRPHRS